MSGAPMTTPSELMQRATALHQARNPAAAAALYEKVLALDPGDADALHLLGVARGQGGDNKAALALIGKAIERRGDVAVYHLNLARALSRLGDKEGMVAALHRSIALDGRDDAARIMLTRYLMPGPGYGEILKRMHYWLRPASYLEIGVESGRSLALAQPPTRAIGIDPAPQIEVGFTAETKIFKITSDDFFTHHDPAKEFARPVIDLAFIDGLHLFEQTLRDFINVERHAGPRSVILVHDCLPVDEMSAARDRRGLFWTGDVWKLIPGIDPLAAGSGGSQHRCPPLGPGHDHPPRSRFARVDGELRGDRRCSSWTCRHRWIARSRTGFLPAAPTIWVSWKAFCARAVMARGSAD